MCSAFTGNPRFTPRTILGEALSGDTEIRKRAAWNNATPTQNTDIRIDCDGRKIRWHEYGQLSEFGWEIDHIVPLAVGFGLPGIDTLSNLRARHWRGNRSAGARMGNTLANIRR